MVTVCIICIRILAIQSSIISRIKDMPSPGPCTRSPTPDLCVLANPQMIEACTQGSMKGIDHYSILPRHRRSKTRGKHYVLLSSEWRGGSRVLPFVPCQPYKVPTLERPSPQAVHKTPACLQSFCGVQEMGCLDNTAGTLPQACSLHPTLPHSAPSS